VDDKLAAAVRKLRIVSVAEAVSFLVLLVFGSLMSRVTSVNLVPELGPLHGVLFLAYLVLLADVWKRAGWSGGRAALFLLLAVLPTGGFFADRKLREEFPAARGAAAGAVGA
jgi:integral membrane protein